MDLNFLKWYWKLLSFSRPFQSETAIKIWYWILNSTGQLTTQPIWWFHGVLRPLKRHTWMREDHLLVKVDLLLKNVSPPPGPPPSTNSETMAAPLAAYLHWSPLFGVFQISLGLCHTSPCPWIWMSVCGMWSGHDWNLIIGIEFPFCLASCCWLNVRLCFYVYLVENAAVLFLELHCNIDAANPPKFHLPKKLPTRLQQGWAFLFRHAFPY